VLGARSGATGSIVA